MTAKVWDILNRQKRMVDRKSPWMEYWQRLGDILLPNNADFTVGTAPGQPRTDRIYDGQPRLAARQLITTVDGLLKPKHQRWFWLTVDDQDLAEVDEVKYWLEDTTDRMWHAIYRQEAKFTQRSGEVDESLIIYGLGALWCGLNRDQNGLSFRSFRLRDFHIDENGDGVVDVFSVTENLTPRQAVQRWGEKAMSKAAMDSLNGDAKLADKKLPFMQMILPRDDRDAIRIDAQNKPYASIVVDVDNEHIVKESGFDEFPVAVPRWDTAPGEIYARSPGMYALPDARTLQAMAKTLLRGGQRAVDPPTWAISDGVLSPVRTFPGGLTIISADAVNQMGGRPPLGVLDMGQNIPLGREMQQDVRMQVEAAFFKDIFSMPIEGRQMTATEILERKEEYQRTIGPVFGRLESDYIGHITERVFKVMMRFGAFLPMPEVLAEAGGLKFEYMSPVQQARKQSEAAGLIRAFEVLGPLAEVQPEIIDNFDGDQIARDAPEWANFTQKWLRPKSTVEELRASRQQQMEAQAAIQTGIQGAQAGADVVKNIAQAEQSVMAQPAVA